MKLEFKDGVNPRDMEHFTPNCRILFIALLEFCAHKDLPITITSLINDRDGVKSKSRSHAEGRAFDVRSSHWEKHHLEDCVFYFNTYYRNIAAISAGSGVPTACVYGDARHLDHMHFQVRPQ